MTYRGPSEAQSNAEALARRERPYASMSRPKQRPQGFSGVLRWFVRMWEAEVPERTHISGVEWDTPGRIQRADGSGVSDPGGGNALGAPRYAADARSFIFGPWDATDADGLYLYPMHWAADSLRRNHPLKSALLRMIGMGGDWHTLSVTCPGCQASVTLPDEYAEAVARDALGMAVRHYADAPVGNDYRVA